MIEIVLFHVLAAMCGASFGLLTVWAGLGRIHWLGRFVLIAAVIGCLFPVPAFDVALVLVSQALVVAVALMLVRRCTAAAGAGGSLERPTTWLAWSHFSLGDLFRATLMIAAVCCVVTNLPGEVRAQWWKHVLVGATLGVATLAGAYAALERRRVWFRWVVLCLAAPLAGAASPLDGTIYSDFGKPGWPWCAVTASVGFLVALWLCLAKAAGFAAFHRAEGPPAGQPATAPSAGAFRRRLASAVLGLLSLAILLFLSLAYHDMLHPAPIPTGPPQPNAFDDLLRLSAALQSVATPGSPATEAERQAWAERRRVLFDEVHSALRRPGAVTIQYESKSVELDDIQALRQLCRDLHAEGERHRLAGNTIDAQRSYLDLVELGLASSRGGMLVHHLIAAALEKDGIEGLYQVRGELSREQRRALIAALRAHEAGWEPAGELQSRELAWQHRAYGWPVRISFLNPFSMTEISEPAERVGDLRSTRFRLLICELALAQYVADHGGPPAQLARLVPQYLPEVPPDPFSGQPLIYRVEPAPGYVLYSVGPDRRDDGGPRGATSADDDMFLERAM